MARVLGLGGLFFKARDTAATREWYERVLGIDFMDWRKPVIAGDVLTGFSLVLEARRSRSKPDLGIVKFRNEITNQAGEPVAISECTVLFRAREKGPA